MKIQRRRPLRYSFFRHAQQSSRGRIFDHPGNISNLGYGYSIGPYEEPFVAVVPVDAEATLMNERVMLRAQKQKIIE